MLALLLAACAPQPAPLTPAPTTTGAPVPVAATRATSTQPAPTATAPPATRIVQPSATPPLPSATPTPPFAVCSPLEGISLADLSQPDLLKNPFEQPRPGMDDGHHGVDFAYWSRGERNTMLGLPVNSVMDGRVAGVLENRQPYGYAVIIETPLEALPGKWLAAMELPASQPTVPAAPNLICPPDPLTYGQPGSRSLYLLYAHLDQPPALAVGQPVACGDPLGVVGTTGRSVNYHLHLETRIGPSESIFPGMAHYEASASEVEMSTYCTWRVSGLFAIFDPMLILK